MFSLHLTFNVQHLLETKSSLFQIVVYSVWKLNLLSRHLMYSIWKLKVPSFRSQCTVFGNQIFSLQNILNLNLNLESLLCRPLMYITWKLVVYITCIYCIGNNMYFLQIQLMSTQHFKLLIGVLFLFLSVIYSIWKLYLFSLQNILQKIWKI